MDAPERFDMPDLESPGSPGPILPLLDATKGGGGGDSGREWGDLTCSLRGRAGEEERGERARFFPDWAFLETEGEFLGLLATGTSSLIPASFLSAGGMRRM